MENNEIMILVGRKIRTLRKALYYSQKDLSDQVGMHRNYISMIENAKANPTLLNLFAISQALQITLSELLEF